MYEMMLSVDFPKCGSKASLPILNCEIVWDSEKKVENQLCIFETQICTYRIDMTHNMN